MAEAAGLALGAVALVSLFQTAVECFEYFQLARDLDHDQQLAVTKIRLLETRLREWGDVLQAWHPGQEDGGLRQRWGEDGRLVARSLNRISDILTSAARLEENYGLYKKRSRPRLGSLFLVLCYHTRSACSSPQKLIRESASVRKQVVWAVRDKKKLDSLIFDLDFLVTNLEKVSIRLHRLGESHEPPYQMPQPSHLFPVQSLLFSLEANTCYSEAYDLDISADAIMSNNINGNGNGNNGSLTGILHRERLQRQPAQQSATAHTVQQPGHRKAGHEYIESKAEGHSIQVNGDFGSNAVSNHKYQKPFSKENAFQHNGNSTNAEHIAGVIQAQAQSAEIVGANHRNGGRNGGNSGNAR